MRELHLAKNKLQVIENIGHLKKLYMLTLQANFIETISGLDDLPQLEQLYFQQNSITHISGLKNLKKLEILDLAINKVQKIENLESQADCLEELWMNGNQITDFADIEYLGKTLKKCTNLYIATNPVYSRSNEFIKKIKEVVPCLEQLEGNPFDRPVYYYTPPESGSIFKKGMNPKA